MTLVLSIVAFVLAFVVLVWALREQKHAQAALEKAVAEKKDVEEAREDAKRHSFGAAGIVITHKHDPGLRPLHLLLVVVPDDAYAVEKDDILRVAGSKKSITDSDYVVAVWPGDGRAEVIKWRDQPMGTVEVATFLPESVDR